jgi:hypothetical protein
MAIEHRNGGDPSRQGGISSEVGLGWLAPGSQALNQAQHQEHWAVQTTAMVLFQLGQGQNHSFITNYAVMFSFKMMPVIRWISSL